MTKREIEIKVRLNEKEAEHLNRQVEKCRLSREAYLRHLIAGVVPREARRRNTLPSCGSCITWATFSTRSHRRPMC